LAVNNMAIDWSQYKGATSISTSGIDWSRYGGQKEPAQKTNFWGGVGTFLKGLTLLPKTMAASVLQATQGQKGASVTDRDWADEFISGVSDDIDSFIQETRGEYGEAKMLPGMPFKITDIAALPQNLAFSITSMGTGAAVGIPTALTGIGLLASGAVGGVASGAAAYSMTTYQIMQQYLEAKDAEKRNKTGKGLTKQEEAQLRDDFDEKAVKYGLWEAVPEGLSNVVFAGAWSKPFIAALQKTAGKSIAGKVAGAVIKTYASELATETITQKGQAGIEADVGLREKDITLTEAFQEVFPQTFLLTTLMAGAGSATIPIATAKRKIQNSLKNEAKAKNISTTDPVYQQAKTAIDEGIQEQPIEDLLFQEARKYKSAEEFVKAQTDFIHETNIKNIKEFDLSKVGSNTQDSWLGRGIYAQKKGEFKIEKFGKNEIEVGLTPNAKIFKIEDTPSGKWRDTFVEWYAKRHPELESGLEKWENPKNVLPRDLLMNKDASSDIIKEIKKAGFDGLLQDGELVIYNPEVLKTKSQLTDIFNQAVKTTPDGKTPSGIATGFAQKAKQKGIEGLPSVATYEASTIKEQERLMKQYFDQGGIEIAADILDGKRALPQGVKAINFLDELEKHIQRDPRNPISIELSKKMVSSPLATVGSEAGSTLGLAQRRDGNSYVQRVQRVNKELSKRRTTVKPKDVIAATKKRNLTAAELNTKLTKFIEDNICKG